jgi:methylmalonyl-CoA/ethylmalonyl-CoA epimerase
MSKSDNFPSDRVSELNHQLLHEMTFHHLGVFVSSLDVGIEYLERLFPIIKFGSVFHDAELKVSIQFIYMNDGTCIELVAPYGDGNPVDGVLKSKRNILNHLAFQVKNFDSTLNYYRQLGCLMLSEPKPALAFQGARVVFFLTKIGLIIELVELLI